MSPWTTTVQEKKTSTYKSTVFYLFHIICNRCMFKATMLLQTPLWKQPSEYPMNAYHCIIPATMSKQFFFTSVLLFCMTPLLLKIICHNILNILLFTRPEFFFTKLGISCQVASCCFICKESPLEDCLLFQPPSGHHY